MAEDRKGFQSADSPTEAALHRPTLLLVDDNPVDRMAIIRLVEPSFTVVEAGTAAEGLEAAASRNPEVVLLDYRLPDREGIDVLRELVEMRCTVVMLTGQGDERIAVAALRAGAVDYLTKDRVDRASLFRALNYAVETRALRSEILRSEAEARTVQDRFQMLFESSLIGVLVSAPDGTILDCNDTLVGMLGYRNREHLMAQRAESLLAHPEARADFLNTVERSGEVALFENELRTASGDSVRVLDNAIGRFDDDGALLELYHSVVDVTDRRATERERDLLVEAIAQAAEAFVVTDSGGRIELVNPAFERMTGFTADEVLGFTFASLRSGEHDDAFFADLWQTISRGDVWRGRIVNRRKDDTLMTADTTISSIRGEDGRIERYLAFQTDATRELELERQLQASQQLEAVGQLAGGIAHDFNNLMSVVLTNTEQSLASGSIPEEDEVRHLLVETRQAALSGRSLTKQLLAFGRQQMLRPRVLNMNDVIEEVLPMLARALGEDIVIERRLKPGVGNVLIDDSRFHAILLNLAINARDAMPEGGRLTVETSEVTVDEVYRLVHTGAAVGRFVVLSVSDTGVGMDEATRTKVFDPFFTTKAPGRGSGMGLAMVFGTVKQSGGSIWVYSEPGEGTTFKIYLPRVEREVEGDPSEDWEPAEAGRLRVALVEDNEAVRRGIHRTLEGLGHEVVLAVGPDHALESLQDAGDGFDLLVTDMVMPGISGVEIAEIVSQARPEIRVLFVSGHPADTAFLGRRPSVPHSFLEKPFTQDELGKAVREIITGG